jgi:hypothetical protein
VNKQVEEGMTKKEERKERLQHSLNSRGTQRK